MALVGSIARNTLPTAHPQGDIKGGRRARFLLQSALGVRYSDISPFLSPFLSTLKPNSFRFVLYLILRIRMLGSTAILTL